MEPPDPSTEPGTPDGVLAEAFQVGHLPSVVATCFVARRVLWTGAVGSHAKVSGREADVTRQYRIGSITKTLTAAAVMQLRDAGEVALDDPVSRFVGDAPFGQHRLRTLLSHSAGLPAEPAGNWWERNDGVDTDELWARNVERAQVFSTGERYHYSNLSFALLGAAVEQVSGLGWMAYLEQHLLEPLGMHHTTYLPRPGAAEGTSWTPDGRLVAEPATDTGAMAPAGQLWGTVADLATWGDLLAGGRPDVLAPSTLVEMQTVQSGDPTNQHEGAYGLAQRLTWTPTGTLVGHSGSMPGFLADLQVDPRTGAGAVVLTNATTTAGRHDTARRLVDWSRTYVQSPDTSSTPPWGSTPVLAQLAARGPGDPDAARGGTSELAGRWYWGNTPLDITRTDSGFVVADDDGHSHFHPLGADTYLGLNGYTAGETLTVRRDDQGRAVALDVATFVFARISSPG